MTLRQKGTRTISVDDTLYRWTVAPDDEPGIAIVVEHASSPAQKLVHWVDHGMTITPALVRRAILVGLRSGWTPTEVGRDFVQRYFNDG